MLQELASIEAHQLSEQDDLTNELNHKYQEQINAFKEKSIGTFKHELDTMHEQFDEDCNKAKTLMGNLFGNTAATASETQFKTNEQNNVAYIVRIQQEYSDMHNQQVRTATTLAEMAREASRLRRDLRESKRAQLLAARARAELPSLILRETTKHRRSRTVEGENEITSKILIEKNRLLVDKLARMSHRHTDLEDKYLMSSNMRMSSLNGGGSASRQRTPQKLSRSRGGSPQQQPLSPKMESSALELSSDSD